MELSNLKWLNPISRNFARNRLKIMLKFRAINTYVLLWSWSAARHVIKRFYDNYLDSSAFGYT